MGCMAGVVLNPGTPLSQIEYVLTEVPRKNPRGLTVLDGFETRVLVPKQSGWVERWDSYRFPRRYRMYEKLSRKLSRAICFKKRCPNPGFFFVDFKSLIASMYVFLLNI